MRSVEVVIATRNRAPTLAKTLRSIAQCSVPRDTAAKITVVDNGSLDDTRAVIEQFSFEQFHLNYQYESRPGKSRCLNDALSRSDAEILLFTDDDVEVPQNWIAAMCDPVWSNSADAVAGTIRLSSTARREWMDRAHLASFAEVTYEDHEEVCLIGANMSIRREFIAERSLRFEERIGPPFTGGGEDTLMGYQIRRAAGRIK